MVKLTRDGHESPLQDDFLQFYKDLDPDWGYDGLGYIVYKRTYARKIGDRTEEWPETMERCANAVYDMHKKLGINLDDSYYHRLYDITFRMKALYSGRFLWQAGTETVDRIGGASFNNCWGTVVDTPETFCTAFDMLMLGGGVGFNIQKQHVYKLPLVKSGVTVSRVDEKDADFIVPDSREGWVRLLREILNAYFYTGESFTYSLALIRGKGEPISGFGGTASGPEPLHHGMAKICNILSARQGKSVRPIDALDIMNCIGELVVAGNVRRSAQIALGDADDAEYLAAKNWTTGKIPNHRASSNNSVVATKWEDVERVIDSTFHGGEPYGFFNIDLARACGRLTDWDRKDPDVVATNPCAEISLSPTLGSGGAESCNLCEIFLNRLSGPDEWEEVAEVMYFVVKAIAMMPLHNKASEKIIHRNLRLGIGVTGVLQRPEMFMSYGAKVYDAIDVLDDITSRDLGVPRSIKLTTIKPSGTLSLLGGATPGIHPAYARHYIRRIRMAADDPLVELCNEAGYNTEYVTAYDGTVDHTTKIVSFPVRVDDNVIIADDMTAVRQLQIHKAAQEVWSDNQVSVTVYYRPEELEDIKRWLRDHYENGVKAVSFLLHSEHGFAQAPYEPITEDLYKEMTQGLKKLKSLQSDRERTLNEAIECLSGGCPVR